MQVILTKDVKGLGAAGAVVEVKEGYGRNFLMPRGLAQEATKANLNRAKDQAALAERKKAVEFDEAQLLAAQLKNLALTLPVRVGEGGKLFGSIGSKQVADALAERGLEMDKRKISLDGDITGPGQYKATLKLHSKVTVTVPVSVVAAEG